MKKLLFITALMAMATTAFAAAPAQGDSVTADVEVRAEITDDSFTITDIDGKPLILDFGKLAKTDAGLGKVWTAEVEYKITAANAPQAETTFDVKLGANKVTMKNLNNALTTANTLEADIALDADSKVMSAGDDTVTGIISGSIVEDISAKETGIYKTNTTLTATVQ